jgi:hypothetical protein
MDVITVTYKKDFKNMLRQAQSIKQYTEPFTHWVIINDNSSLDFWIQNLKQYYTEHTLHLLHINHNTIANVNCGYRRQQLVKLYMAKIIKEKYLVLDSKNFFIKLTSIYEFENQIGSGMLETIEEGHLFYDTVQHYSKFVDNKNKKNKTHISIHTPFVIDPKVMFEFSNSNIDQLIKDFSSYDGLLSEFFLYSMIYEKIKNVEIIEHMKSSSKPIHRTLFGTYVAPDDLVKQLNSNGTKVLGFHPTYLELLSVEDTQKINEYLKNLKFTSLLELPNV